MRFRRYLFLILDFLLTSQLHAQKLETKSYKSVLGNTINVYFIGNSQKNILIIGGVHGDEKASVDLSNVILDSLKISPSYSAYTRVIIIPVLNIDGYQKRTRTNAHKIDINRNFPTRDFGKGSKKGRYFGGEKALSEPETKIIYKILNEFMVVGILVIHTPMECINYDGPADSIAMRMSSISGIKTKSYIGYPTPGSLGTYAGKEKKIPVITLELPAKINSLNKNKYWLAVKTFLTSFKNN